MPKWAKKEDPLVRLMKKVVKTETGCWVFTGVKRNGYAALGVEGKTVYGHRYIYEQMVAPIPRGLVLDHLCHNGSGCPGGIGCPHRACVNPAHLEPVTRFLNCFRGARTGSRVSACKRGHQYTPENTYTNPEGYRVCKTCKKERSRA